MEGDDVMNKAILIGNLGRNPEFSYSQNGSAIAKFSIATSEKWKDKMTGEVQERTEWHRIAAFGRLAEICHEFLSKGRQVCIEGRIQTSSWEKDGDKRYTTEIIASSMKMLGTRNNDQVQKPVEAAAASNGPVQLDPKIEESEIPF